MCLIKDQHFNRMKATGEHKCPTEDILDLYHGKQNLNGLWKQKLQQEKPDVFQFTQPLSPNRKDLPRKRKECLMCCYHTAVQK